MENNGTTAPVAEEQIQPQQVQDSVNQPIESEPAQPVIEPESEPAQDITEPESEAAETAAEQAPEKEAQKEDVTSMTKEQLVAYLSEAIQTKEVGQLRSIVDEVKTAFYKLHNIEVKTKELADQPVEEDPLETRFKELLGIYKTRREQFIVAAEHEKEANYKAKLAIIDELKSLTESNEILNSTFAKFRELQGKWREIGPVPQIHVNDLWETYNHFTEIFYNWTKINRELRDFDLKKNLEVKTSLCERAEQLIEAPSAVEAFHDLQKLHDEWRETGPVAAELKEDLWQRFKEASSRINKRHQEYFEKVKEDQLKNLRLKEELCENIENFPIDSYTTHKQWEEASDKILEIQKLWKTIGFAPKKDNGPIYERYRKACDKFFEAKHNFTDEVKKVLDANYHAKVDICKKAEEIVESITDQTEWKNCTDAILELQKHWKEIGPTARKHSEALWTRFRAACDKFFEAKSNHFKNSENQFIQHLNEKKKLLEEIKATAEENISFDFLKQIQERWSSIGFVPMKEKEAIQKEFKDTMDGFYRKLRGNESERRTEGFRRRIETIRQSGGKLGNEHDKLVQKMRQLESQIQTLENNIGFFGNSKKAETLIKDVQTKIQSVREELNEVIGKIKILEKENSGDNE